MGRHGELRVDGLPTICPCDGIQAGKRSGSYFYSVGCGDLW